MATRRASTKTTAWKLFDRIVDRAALGSHYSNPWHLEANGDVVFQPDFTTLSRLLGVPLYLAAPTTTGVPALALDVWIAYELRRAGFSEDAVWPRKESPRVLPGPVASLIESLPQHERRLLIERILSSAPTGVAPSQALVLGKHYRKQVDVVMSHWATGPEVLVSTKRMDSSFGKNAQNRIEEAYGDAKNLRLRHPMAGLGFLFGIRSTAFTDEPRSADFIADLLMKLAQEDDAYNVTCMLPIAYSLDKASDSERSTADSPSSADVAELTETDGEPAETGGSNSAGWATAAAPGSSRGDGEASGSMPRGLRVVSGPAREPELATLFPESSDSSEEPPEDGTSAFEWQDSFAIGEDAAVDAALASLPPVTIREDLVPPDLRSGHFFGTLVRHVLACTPTTLHEEARSRLRTVQHG